MKNEKKQAEEQEKDEEISFTPSCCNYGKKGHIKP